MDKQNSMNKENEIILSKDEAQFVQADEVLTDTKFETKQISFIHDAFRRFAQNKGSVIAGIIIMFLLTFSIVTPFFSGHDGKTTEEYYAYCAPKNVLFEGTGFWDGTEVSDMPIQEFVMNYESNRVVSVEKKDKNETNLNSYYTVRRDTYIKGYAYKSFQESEFDEIVAYDAKQTDDKDKILAPLVDYSTYVDAAFPGTDAASSTLRKNIKNVYLQNAYISYQITSKSQPVYNYDNTGDVIIDETTHAVSLNYIYKTDTEGNYVYYTKSGDAGAYSYSCRVNFDNYYVFVNGEAPLYVLGSDNLGRDIMTRLALGGRLSLLLGIVVSAINFIIGAIYGAIEGYYGGKVDLVMERISEILSEVPTTIIFVLFNWYLKDKIPTIWLLFFAFIFVGWLGTASTVRMQFYRFKNQEYVLAARTLGAKDSRLIVKHIFPNALGTVVTSSVLMIPGVIFSESSLTYLKIIDLASAGITSIGTMLSDGKSSFPAYPNLIIWPALFISLLMICFNVFGNGLRDAFNPTLRGSEE
ncbi:MAG: ABC transporter permease [Bacilli bacterium]|jgi:oligopeptide transport system permease protein|nr:ABC transporter permease [Bacilli bacterium]MCH4229024.1 ABC transporter permease [Bacilli bacterium]MCH4278191.1 ABC transporter permease [Bacilli bacterium]